MPLSIVYEDGDESRLLKLQPGVIARVRRQAAVGVVADASFDENFAKALVEAIDAGGEMNAEHGDITFTHTRAWQEVRGEARADRAGGRSPARVPRMPDAPRGCDRKPGKPSMGYRPGGCQGLRSIPIPAGAPAPAAARRPVALLPIEVSVMSMVEERTLGGLVKWIATALLSAVTVLAVLGSFTSTHLGMMLNDRVNRFHWIVVAIAWAVGLYALWHRRRPG